MNYTDKYLKFPDEAAANAVLYRIEGAVAADPDNGIEAVEGTPVANYINIDVLGTLYNDDAVLDAEGNVVTPATAIDGWHVNVRVMPGEDAAVLEPYSIVPTMPRRVWG